MSTPIPRTDMLATAQVTLVKPVPKRARAAGNRPAPPHGQKQLIARPGSASAPDPHGTHSTRPARSTISKLTIVRLPQPQISEKEFQITEKKHRRRKTVAHMADFRPASPTRISFASATFSAPTSPAEDVRPSAPEPTSPSRMSFASASFSSLGRIELPRRHARTVSACLQSSGPSQRFTPGLFEHLRPSQVYDLAKSSSRPSANVLPPGYAPSSLFMQIPEEIYLPFLDRPSEVFQLLSNPANNKLMVLFARILPAAKGIYYPHTSCELAATVGSWTFEDFTTWLTQVSREEIDDADWARALRIFVLPKSEMLWEQLKGILGVPPELDVEPTLENMDLHPTMPKGSALNIVPIYSTSFSSSLRIDDISEVAEERGTNPANEVVGLRISTSLSLAFSPSSTSVKGARTVPTSPRARTPVHGYAPIVSSPLVPKFVAQQPRPKSAPPQKSITSSSLSGLLSRIRSKESACPMFPSSFDKLGIQPSLLRIA